MCCQVILPLSPPTVAEHHLLPCAILFVLPLLDTPSNLWPTLFVTFFRINWPFNLFVFQFIHFREVDLRMPLSQQFVHFLNFSFDHFTHLKDSEGSNRNLGEIAIY